MFDVYGNVPVQILPYRVPDRLQRLWGWGFVYSDELAGPGRWSYIIRPGISEPRSAWLCSSASTRTPPLIDKSTDDAVLSIHRLVQAAVTRKLSNDDRSKYFDAAVRIITCGFPNTWREDVGHQFQTWAKCEKYLPHVNHLVKHAKMYSISSVTPQLYG